jgi:hypothetical protein
MRILTANLLATIALALCAPAALAQGMSPGTTGAGGTGGAGGGGDSRRVVVVPEAERTSACIAREPAAPGGVARELITRDRLSQEPALDPSRKVNEVNCTQPFDFLGKGNLCCI